MSTLRYADSLPRLTQQESQRPSVPYEVSDPYEEENPYEEVIPRSPLQSQPQDVREETGDAARVPQRISPPHLYTQRSPNNQQSNLTSNQFACSSPSLASPGLSDQRGGGPRHPSPLTTGRPVSVYAEFGSPLTLANGLSNAEPGIRRPTGMGPTAIRQPAPGPVARHASGAPFVSARLGSCQPAADQPSDAEPLTLASWEQRWESSDMMQCVNQAEQARLSRSFSTGEHEPRPGRMDGHVRRSFADDEHCNRDSVSSNSGKAANWNDADGAVRATRSVTEYRGGSATAPVPVRSRQSDVDAAIAASSSPLSQSLPLSYGRRPSRKMEYVNRKLYQADPKVPVRHLSSTNSSAADPPLPAECGHRNRDSPLEMSQGLTNLVHEQSSQSIPPAPPPRPRFGSVDSDSFSSTEDRPTRPPRQRRATPPSPAPRKLSIDSIHNPSHQ